MFGIHFWKRSFTKVPRRNTVREIFSQREGRGGFKILFKDIDGKALSRSSGCADQARNRYFVFSPMLRETIRIRKSTFSPGIGR